MDGPRQGVHISPLHLQQWRQLHRLMRWRAFHFRDPDDTYPYRARIEPHPPQLPAAEHKQNGSAFPNRGHKRPSSAGGSKSRRSSTAPGVPVSGRATPTGTRTSSSTNLCLSPFGKQNGKTSQKKSGSESSSGQTPGSGFSLSATSMSIQPRQGTQRLQSASKSNKPVIVNVATFPYPDPSKVKGNPGFVSRLAELARLEADTIRSEQAKARLMSRPMSARSLKSSTPYLAGTKPTNGLSNRRTSVSVAAGKTPSVMKRLNSSPVVNGHTHQRGSSSSSSSSSVSISKQLSSSERQIHSRKARGELDVVEEASVNSVHSSTELEKEKLSTEVGKPQGQRSTQRCTSEEPEDDDCEGKVQGSCSPPIVLIRIPQCSWTVGEATPMKETSITDQNKGDRKNSESESIGEEASTPKDDCSSSGISSVETAQDVGGSCQGDKGKTLVEDDLKVTSDLGLSIDSLHLSQEENSEPTAVTMTTTGQSSNGTEHKPKKGMELECDSTSEDKPTGESLVGAQNEAVEKNNVKKTKKVTSSKRLSKTFNRSLSAGQLVSSSSSTSLKSSKSGGKNSHKLLKRSKTVVK